MTDALIAEATRRSGVVWVSAGEAAPRLVWHIWHEGSVYLVTGGREQAVPAELTAAREALVTVRSKDKQGDRVVEWYAEVSRVAPGSPEWEQVVPVLQARRLNGEPDQPERWARESTVLRLSPTGRTRPIPR